jgi:hypothetical protein
MLTDSYASEANGEISILLVVLIPKTHSEIQYRFIE